MICKIDRGRYCRQREPPEHKVCCQVCRIQIETGPHFVLSYLTYFEHKTIFQRNLNKTPMNSDRERDLDHRKRFVIKIVMQLICYTHKERHAILVNSSFFLHLNHQINNINFIYLIFIRVKDTVKKLKIHILHIYINQYKDN